ncbi:MAG: hypothetical protein CL726_07300 [Chloroflexi bacterium]|nr:hypothetical protein [Chloroflexota bacterium]
MVGPVGIEPTTCGLKVVRHPSVECRILLHGTQQLPCSDAEYRTMLHHPAAKWQQTEEADLARVHLVGHQFLVIKMFTFMYEHLDRLECQNHQLLR